MKKRNRLILLGAWSEPPLVAWSWFCEEATKHFVKLTGFQLRPFTYLNSINNLHYQYFLLSDVNKLFDKFKALTANERQRFSKKIFNNYYQESKQAARFLNFLEANNFTLLSDEDLKEMVDKWMKKLSRITMQIWFAVLLDIWYPRVKDELVVKEIAAKARDHSGYLHKELKAELSRLIKKLSKRLKIPAEDIYFLFPDEIITALNTGHLPNIADRKNFFVTFYVNGRYKILGGEKARKILKQYEIEWQSKQKLRFLKGEPACSGKVNGKVKIILLNKEFAKFKKGDILVALQTMINYVPLMKKAKAILTELGGLTSHAAIVSRELKKPCIVGIKNLTSSLKDGDLVEVDAGKGRVEILNK